LHVLLSSDRHSDIRCRRAAIGRIQIIGPFQKGHDAVVLVHLLRVVVPTEDDECTFIGTSFHVTDDVADSYLLILVADGRVVVDAGVEVVRDTEVRDIDEQVDA